MPTYTFKDLKTGEEFDKVMSYEDMLKYKKKKNCYYRRKKHSISVQKFNFTIEIWR